MVAFSVSAITHATSKAYAESFLSLGLLFNPTISLQKFSAVWKMKTGLSDLMVVQQIGDYVYPPFYCTNCPAME